MFVTAFGESFAFISLLFPGTTVLIAAGTLMSAGTLPYTPVLIGAVAGAVLGDSISYWIGRRFGGGIEAPSEGCYVCVRCCLPQARGSPIARLVSAPYRSTVGGFLVRSDLRWLPGMAAVLTHGDDARGDIAGVR